MKYIIVVLFYIFGYRCIAQTPSLLIGTEGGFSSALLRGRAFSHTDARMGHILGIYLQKKISGNYSFKTGLYYESKGASFSVQISSTTVGGEVPTVKSISAYNYATVPLLLHVHYGEKLQIIGNFGPYIGFLLRQNSYNALFQKLPRNRLIGTEYFNKMEIGLSAGAGFAYELNNTFRLSAEMRDNLGLTNINKNMTSSGIIKSNSLYFLLGIAKRVGK